MKTYVITLSQVFPTWHKRAGEPTKFRAAFLSGQTCSKCKKRNPAMCTGECFSGLKIHTIRANYPLWLKRITEVQQGKAVLSVRQWSGKPYRSPQIEKDYYHFNRTFSPDSVRIKTSRRSQGEF